MLLAAMTVLVSVSFAGVDKSGVKPNTISLPKGPGSIEGLGESFEPTLNNGMAKYAVPLNVPPGSAGNTPGLGLTYEGGRGNGPLGLGWELSPPYVQRQTDKGIPRYIDGNNGLDDDQDGSTDEPDEIDQFINEAKEELVPQADGYYFCENEGAFVRYERVADYWKATAPDGTVMLFGLTSTGRVVDIETGHVFKWLLEKTIDTHGNTIVYTYSSFAGDENRNQKYFSGIRYGPGAPPWQNFHFVSLLYESRADWFEDCRPGFIVRTGKRLREVLVGTQGPTLANHLAGDFNADGVADNLNRRYVLSYLDTTVTNVHGSFLAGVLPIGADGTSAFPSITFGYGVHEPPASVSAAGQIIGSVNEPFTAMDSASVDLIDLNGDALPDILKTFPYGGEHQGFLNEGETNAAGGKAIRWSSARPVPSSDGLTWNVDLQSTEKIAHLADMDGDGLADLAYRSPGLYGAVYYFRNNGACSWGQRKTMSVQDFTPPTPFGDANVKTADIDFDKRIDIIQSIGTHYQIWFNLGEQRYSRRVTVAQENGYLFSLSGVDIADFNGDRVPDIARVRSTTIEVTAGLGHGHFADKVTVTIPDATLTDQQIKQARLQDINGDGLVDLVLERAGPLDTLWYWVNRGNYTLGGKKIVTGLPTGLGTDPSIRWADINGNGTVDLIYSDSYSLPRIRSVDLGELIGAGTGHDMLTSIDNGIGAKTRIVYETSTRYLLEDKARANPWPDPLPFPVNVVGAAIVDDSLGHAYTNTYVYHAGYYDPEEKEFRGFARVEQVVPGDATAPTLVTRSYFDTGRNYEVMKGKVLRLTAEREDGAVFWDAMTGWEIPPRRLRTGINGQDVMYASATSSVKTITECGQGEPRVLESASAYDDYGNQTWSADYGIVSNGNRLAFEDERFTTNRYAVNLDQWILRAPMRSEIMDGSGHVAARTENYYDDETFSGANLGVVTTGDLTMTRAWIDPDNPTAYVATVRSKYDAYGNLTHILDPLASAAGGIPDPDAGHYRELVYDSTFHAWPEHEIIHVGGGKTPLTIRAGYDKGFGVIVSSVDPNGHTTTYGYDAFGRPVNVLRPGDSPAYPSAEYQYAMAQPFGPSGLLNYVETRALDKTPGSAGSKRDHYLIARGYVSGLGQKLMTRTEGERPGQIVVGDTIQFNARKLPWKTYMPYFEENGSFDFVPPTFTNNFAEHFYDALGREIRINQPIGSNGVEYSTVTYEPMVKIGHDEEQTKPDSPHFGCGVRSVDDGMLDKDGKGRLREAYELVKLSDTGEPLAQPVEWRTTYSYDVLGNLLGHTDSKGNRQINRFDALGRQTYMNNPDRGEMFYTYDAVSNLRETRDAKGQVIRCTYDGANRLLTEDYLDEGLPFSFNRSYDPTRPLGPTNMPDVAYFYDTPAGPVDLGDGTSAVATNTKGFLTRVVDLSGEDHTSYDDRGRIAYEVKRIPDLVNGAMASYTTRFNYDVMDRLTTLTYPDNDQVHYEYNDRGLMKRILGGPALCIVSNAGYTAAGQFTELGYGNGVKTRYGYDERFRLVSLITAHTTNALNPAIAFEYAFDGASNIRSIRDQRPGAVVPSGNARRNTQMFEYDNLYRLTRVQYSFNLPGEPLRSDGFINYRYDPIGNMVSQASDMVHEDKGFSVTDLGAMSYGGALGSSGRIGRATNDPPGPHALTEIQHSTHALPEPARATRHYPYDANGNMTDIDGLQCVWDFKDRLVAVENAEMRAEYTYDFTGRRITKHVTPKSPPTTNNQQLTTTYIGKHYEIREHDKPIKYVFNGDTRVAQLTAALSANLRSQRLRVDAGWNLLSLAVTALDVVGQLGVGTNSVVEAIAKWNHVTRDFAVVNTGDTVQAGTVLWVKASASAVLSVLGTFEESTNLSVQAGGQYVPCVNGEPLDLTTVLSTNALVWAYDTQARSWQTRLPGELAGLPNAPKFLAPGQAIFVRADTDLEIPALEKALRTRYYHQDHLGSSSYMSDADGQIVEETTFYPYGYARNAFQPTDIEAYYKFTQKEQDRESGLQYFEARYYHPITGRFISVDPILDGQNWYAYANNNPQVFVDVLGTSGDNAITKAVDAYWAKYYRTSRIVDSRHAFAEAVEIFESLTQYPYGPGYLDDKWVQQSSGLNCHTWTFAVLKVYLHETTKNMPGGQDLFASKKYWDWTAKAIPSWDKRFTKEEMKSWLSNVSNRESVWAISIRNAGNPWHGGFVVYRDNQWQIYHAAGFGQKSRYESLEAYMDAESSKNYSYAVINISDEFYEAVHKVTHSRSSGSSSGSPSAYTLDNE
ncbi:MAG: SpvB/TcaC N-terminal domain-containing protein [bacterium]